VAHMDDVIRLALVRPPVPLAAATTASELR
jgi:hypothetical protein